MLEKPRTPCDPSRTASNDSANTPTFEIPRRQKPSLKHDKLLICEQRVCGKQDRHRLGFYEVGREETQEKGKILEENAQAAQEESAR